ncbi:MAG: efflux RND transporter periplasmic adaptor subunit [Desulfovibrio sp.]|nr:efflux RND transporter periplasmic adaptor subunit [Desulfovibrio sp.]
MRKAIGQGFCLIFCACLLAGCQEKTAQQSSYAEVRYMEVAEVRIMLTHKLPGRVTAFTSSEVRPQVSGIIQARLFEEGANVEAGQVLYQIDPVMYQAAYNNAKANLEQAGANEEAARLRAQRYAYLAQSRAASVQDRDDAIAAYNQLRAEIDAHREALEIARINLGYTKVAAPVSGRIGRSFVTEGNLVTQNQITPLAKIQQISPVNVDITQSHTQMLKLRRSLASGALKSGGSDSAKVRLYLEDDTPYMRPDAQGQNNWLEGDLMFSDFSVNESTGSVLFRAKFENPDSLLFPGMYVRAELVEGILENAILAPQKSVTRDAGNLPQVFVLLPAQAERGGMPNAFRVEARSITLDRDYENNWIVASGLRAGELLLVDGVQKVRPGQLVRGSSIVGAGGQANRADAGDALMSSASRGR